MPWQDLPSSEQWVEALKPDEAAFLAELPFTYAIPSHGLLVVHAGMVPNKPKLLQDWLDIYMVRPLHARHDKTCLTMQHKCMQYQYARQQKNRVPHMVSSQFCILITCGELS